MPANEAFLCDGVRTPIGRFGGALSAVRTDDLAAAPIKALLARHPHLAAHVEEVVMGCANQAGEDNRNVARMASLLAGLPEEVPALTVNRLCASGLDAVGAAARAIASGEIGLAIAGGVEGMTRAPFVTAKATEPFQRHMESHDTTIGWRFVNHAFKALHGTDSMPETAEHVAREHQISRDDQDAFAERSQARAAKAQDEGVFAQEIVAVEIPTRKGDHVKVDQDEHLRRGTTREQLARLKPITASDGTVTAGNASGVNDGAAALLLADRASAERHGLTPKARVLGMASAGVPPRVMGIGPVPAVERLLARLGLGMGDFDLIELNEAFAAQALAVLRGLGLPDDADHVNPNGGAIALGHPLGMSGARLALTAMRQLERNGGRRALVTMCVGVGQGVAMALERVD